MARLPRAPRWLTESFAIGASVYGHSDLEPRPAYAGASRYCWLAQFDQQRRPCEGQIEACHAIPRERVKNALWALLPNELQGTILLEAELGFDWEAWRKELILLACWDARNSFLGCGEQHHPRFDRKQTPALLVPRREVPLRVTEFIAHWGFLDAPWLLSRFPPA